MKPSKTIREMDSSKLLKEFESEVNEYGGKRYDSLGNIMPRYNQNKIKMMRAELFRRLKLVKEDNDIPTLILGDIQFSKVEGFVPIESLSNDEYIKLAEESNIKIRNSFKIPNHLL